MNVTMQAVKEQIDAAFPNLTSGEVESVLNKFMSLGVDCPGDLDFLTEGDLAGILKSIRAKNSSPTSSFRMSLTAKLQNSSGLHLLEPARHQKQFTISTQPGRAISTHSGRRCHQAYNRPKRKTDGLCPKIARKWPDSS
ncbi:uncharacterized protein ISCGN_013259 [Ixodes scapularis]